MKRFPALTAKQVIRILKGFGFQEDRQRGSHLILINSLTKRRTIVPIHPGKTVKKPLLKSIVEKDVGVSIEEFLKYL